MIKVSFILLFVIVLVLVAVINNRNKIKFAREQANEIRDFFNLFLIMEKGEPNVLYIDYTNDDINENFIGYLKENGIVYTVDVVEQDGKKNYKVIYKEYLDYGEKYIHYHIQNYPFADIAIPNIYTEPSKVLLIYFNEIGEKIARSFFYTNTYLNYKNEECGTFVIEYKDITGYITKEIKQYTGKEYCSDDYMNEVYAVRKYVIKHFQKLLEENTQYYTEIEYDGDYTVLLINEK